MFLQVSVLPCDLPSLRFFLAGGHHIKNLVRKYTRHIFGENDLPTCTNYAIQRMATDKANEYPEATKAVLENFYMDDYFDSVESPKRALNISKQFVNLLHLVWLILTKFVSNVPDLADRIDGSAQPTDPKVIISFKEEWKHVLTQVVSRGTNSNHHGKFYTAHCF